MNKCRFGLFVLGIALSLVNAAYARAQAIGLQKGIVNEPEVATDEREANERYKVWNAEVNISEKYAIAREVIWKAPYTKSAMAIFYTYFFDRESDDAVRLSIAREYLGAIEASAKGYSVRRTDAEQCADGLRYYAYREYALAYVAVYTPTQSERAEAEARYCRDYTCGERSLLRKYQLVAARPPN